MAAASAFAATQPAAAQSFTVDGIVYNILSETGKTVEVTKNTSNNYSGNIHIPANVTNGTTEYTVAAIGDEAFRNCTRLTSVNIAEGLASIKEKAFYNCSALTTVKLPASLRFIGTSAFYGCFGLAAIDIPENVTTIKEDAFDGCSSLKSVEIPASITSKSTNEIYV